MLRGRTQSEVTFEIRLRRWAPSENG